MSDQYTDRQRQDELIRYVAAARMRTKPPADLTLAPEQTARAERFARWLARNFYREALLSSFHHSAPFSAKHGLAAEQVLSTAVFEKFLDECTLGSFDSARRVGEMAVMHVGEIPEPPPWWRELLMYERACFLQAATSDRGARSEFARRGQSTLSNQFEWNLPELIKRLRANAAIGDDLRQPTTLLFSRTAAGRPIAAQVDESTQNILLAVNGFRHLEKIAAVAGTTIPFTRQYLLALEKVGAVILPEHLEAPIPAAAPVPPFVTE